MEEESDQQNESHPLEWVKLLIQFSIAIIVFISIYMIIKWFNQSGITQGLSKTINTFGGFLDNLVNGCITQADCSKLTGQSEATCEAANGCIYIVEPTTTDTDDDTKTKCIKKDPSKKTGDGSVWSPKCLFGLGGALMYLGFVLSGPLVALLYNSIGPRDNIKYLKEKGYTDASEKCWESGERRAARALETANEAGIELTDRSSVGKAAGTAAVSDETANLAASDSALEDQAAKTANEQTAVIEAQHETIEAEARERGQSQGEAERTADEITEKIETDPLGGHPVTRVTPGNLLERYQLEYEKNQLHQRIKRLHKYRIELPDRYRKYLQRRVQHHNIKLSVIHQDYIR